MFTGLIQAVGRIDEAQPVCGEDGQLRDLHLRIGTGMLEARDLQLGESIAVSGVCLTVVACDDRSFSAYVSHETLALTTLGALLVGAPVNLERALLPTSRLGGHLVAGHVDGLGRVQSINADGLSQRWRFTASSALLRYIAVKGSVCVDGVSLTVNVADATGFEVNLVPHTIANTVFAQTTEGAAVNLEVDLIARYVERLNLTAR